MCITVFAFHHTIVCCCDVNPICGKPRGGSWAQIWFIITDPLRSSQTSDLGISAVVSEFGIPIFVGAASCWQPVIAADQASGKQTGTFDRLVDLVNS